MCEAAAWTAQRITRVERNTSIRGGDKGRGIQQRQSQIRTVGSHNEAVMEAVRRSGEAGNEKESQKKNKKMSVSELTDRQKSFVMQQGDITLLAQQP